MTSFEISKNNKSSDNTVNFLITSLENRILPKQPKMKGKENLRVAESWTTNQILLLCTLTYCLAVF